MNVFVEKTCCFSGHRNIPENKYDLICNSVEETIDKLVGEGYRYFGTGGALGFDTIAAKAVLKAKLKYPHIRLILVLPCVSQAKLWSERDIQIYEDIKKRADKVVYTNIEYTNNCMQKRNRHLVDNSSVCVCYINKSSGGTYYTVNYAKRKGLRVINV
ncbi:MAG: DUF1273 family protein [Clostridia bacterium]|nr:DUF1273 family protein [Clostridia bacterium]